MGDFLNPPPETALRAMRGPEALGQGQPLDPPFGSEPPTDAFARLMKFLQGYPTHVQEAVVTGPGKDTMRANIPLKLFNYLDRAPQRFLASEAEHPRGIAGSYEPWHPAQPSGVLGQISVDPKYSEPTVWTHESMHAANDLTRLNRGIRETEKLGAPMSQYDILSRDTSRYPRAYVMDTNDKRPSRLLEERFKYQNPRWTSPADEAFLAAMEQPGMRAYHENYAAQVPNMSSAELKLEAINEWQTRNALNNQPAPIMQKQYKNEWYTPEQMASQDSSITQYIKKLLGGQ